MKNKYNQKFSRKFKSALGNYGFADLEENGSLKIRIARALENGAYERDGFTISQDDMREICGIFSGSVSPSEPLSKDRAYTLADKREEQGVNAYTPWTKEEENLLCKLYNEGLSISDIAKTLNRGNGAITSRLSKLGIQNI